MVVLAGKLLAGLWEACFFVTVPVRERLANTNSERSILMAVVHVLKSGGENIDNFKHMNNL